MCLNLIKCSSPELITIPKASLSLGAGGSIPPANLLDQKAMKGSLIFKNVDTGMPGGSAVECLPSAQGVILESQDQFPLRAPCMEPASPSACVSASLSVSLMNK